MAFGIPGQPDSPLLANTQAGNPRRGKKFRTNVIQPGAVGSSGNPTASPIIEHIYGTGDHQHVVRFHGPGGGKERPQVALGTNPDTGKVNMAARPPGKDLGQMTVQGGVHAGQRPRVYETEQGIWRLYDTGPPVFQARSNRRASSRGLMSPGF